MPLGFRLSSVTSERGIPVYCVEAEPRRDKSPGDLYRGKLRRPTDRLLPMSCVRLANGRTVKGFLCETYAKESAEGITDFGG